MPKKEISSYERVKLQLFDASNDSKLSEADQRVKKRVLSIYNLKLDDPLIDDKEIVSMLKEVHEISPSQAYADISAVESMFGDFRKNNKEYIRFIITETQKFAMKKEREMLESGKKKSTGDLSKASKVLAAAHGLEREDPNMPNWDDINLPDITPSDDVTIHDLKNYTDETIDKLKKKYESRQNIEDAQVIDSE